MNQLSRIGLTSAVLAVGLLFGIGCQGTSGSSGAPSEEGNNQGGGTTVSMTTPGGGGGQSTSGGGGQTGGTTGGVMTGTSSTGGSGGGVSDSCESVRAGAPSRRLNVTELEFAVADVYGVGAKKATEPSGGGTPMPPQGDECNRTAECQAIWGGGANDCLNSQSSMSICMCGDQPCYVVHAPKPKPKEEPLATWSLKPDFSDALPQEGSLGGFSTVGSALDSGVLFTERYVDMVEAMAPGIVGDLERPCNPGDSSAGECGFRILEPSLRRLYRGEVSTQERAKMVGLIDKVSKEQGFDVGLRAGVMASLTSTQFLFATLEAPKEADKPRGLEGREIATKLALSLWLSVPDKALLEAAQKGELADDAGLAAQVDRMMADEKFNRFIDLLVDRWLGLDQLDQADVDLEAANLTKEQWALLREDMKQESRRLIAHIIKEDLPISEIFEADYSFLNQRLADHYGIAFSSQDEWVRTALPPTRHAGVLTHGGMLANLGDGERVSVIHRGNALLAGYLCQTFPDPPGALLEEVAQQAASLELSEREKLTKRAEDNRCAGCHSSMDPAGWSLAGFDNLGKERQEDEAGAPISFDVDWLGREVTGIGSFIGLVRESRPNGFERCMTSRLLTYSAGRVFDVQARKEDACLVDEILEASTTDQKVGLRTLTRSLFLGPAFRQQGPEIIEGAIKKEGQQ